LKLIVAMAGASGSIYSARFLKKLLEFSGESYFIASPAAIRIFREEFECSINSPHEILDYIIQKWKVTPVHKIQIRPFKDIGADIASGSNFWDGMVVVPCSMKTIASIHAGLTENLIERCADVSLKERRKLILVPRETPYNQIHLKNMLGLDQAGAIILPASPGFYQLPRTLEDLGDFIAGRIFGILGQKEHGLFPNWNPMESE